MWSNSFILETRKLESEKYEKNLESRITESEGLWKVIQVQRRELCWQNKVHGAKVWMKVTATGRAELEESSTNVSGHHRKACPSLTYGQSFAVCLIFQLRRHREEPIYTPPSDNRALRIPHPPVYKNLLPEPAEIHSSPGWGGSCYGGWIFRLGCAGAGQAKRLSSSISPCSSIEPQGVSKF
ncbi:uncharacterized protein LOC144288669 isoform X8 [Canis aureus]